MAIKSHWHTPLKEAVYKNKQFLRFLATGVANTIVGVSAFYILYYVGLPYWAACLGSLMIGIVNNFINYRKFVFTAAANSYFHRYCCIHLSLYFANLYCRHVLVSFGLTDRLIYLILFPPSVVAAYTLSHLFVFPSLQKREKDV